LNSHTAPSKVQLWIPCPLNQEYQNIQNLVIEPNPKEIVADRYGNKWAYHFFDKLNGAQKITIKCDFISTAVAFTMGKYIYYSRSSIPNLYLKNYLNPTKYLDLNSIVIRKADVLFPMDPVYLSKLMNIQDYIIKSISNVKNDNCDTASCFMNLGQADDLGHALSFAALSRKCGIPAKNIGAFIIPNTNSKQVVIKEYSWNQA
jgi:hypothetical protein